MTCVGPRSKMDRGECLVDAPALREHRERRLSSLASAKITGRPYWTALHHLAGDEHRAGSAVAGAQARVLGHTAAELLEREQHHVVGATNAFHVAHEALHRIRHMG